MLKNLFYLPNVENWADTFLFPTNYQILRFYFSTININTNPRLKSTFKKFSKYIVGIFELKVNFYLGCEGFKTYLLAMMDIEWADLLLLPRLLQSKLGYRQTYVVPLCTSLSLELSSEQFQYTLQLSTKVKVYILRLDFLQVLVDRENVTRLTPSPTSG